MTEARTKHTNNAADSLLSCLLEMADAETNPVLQIINPELPLEENKKYPADLLQFNQTGWRAYYHCHPATRAGNHRFEGEHGHFHIFVRSQNAPEEWSHLVALAMDNMGQPMGWFTVNHWVTGETWQDAEILINQLKYIPFDRQTTLIERWILSLIDLNKDKIADILAVRDKLIKEQQATDLSQDIKQDKGLYLLSETVLNVEDVLNNIIQNKA